MRGMKMPVVRKNMENSQYAELTASQRECVRHHGLKLGEINRRYAPARPGWVFEGVKELTDTFSNINQSVRRQLQELRA